MSDPETLDVYAKHANDYATLVGTSLPDDPLLRAFIDALPPAARVLDLGCGTGQAAHVMAQAGLGVVATDAVAEMVKKAARHQGVTARLATFEDITETSVYDGIWANFSLLHASRDAMPRHLRALHRALKPQGIFHIGLKTGTGTRRDSLGRLYTYYTETELTELLQGAGFTVTHRTAGRDKGLDGHYADWIALRAYG